MRLSNSDTVIPSCFERSASLATWGLVKKWLRRFIGGLLFMYAKLAYGVCLVNFSRKYFRIFFRTDAVPEGKESMVDSGLIGGWSIGCCVWTGLNG